VGAWSADQWAIQSVSSSLARCCQTNKRCGLPSVGATNPHGIRDFLHHAHATATRTPTRSPRVLFRRHVGPHGRGRLQPKPKRARAVASRRRRSQDSVSAMHQSFPSRTFPVTIKLGCILSSRDRTELDEPSSRNHLSSQIERKSCRHHRSVSAGSQCTWVAAPGSLLRMGTLSITSACEKHPRRHLNSSPKLWLCRRTIACRGQIWFEPQIPV
jgi:hypothetical protein